MIVIPYVEEVCVREDRDILFIDFTEKSKISRGRLKENTPIIKDTLEWLNVHEIKYELIGSFSTDGWLEGYPARYYVDVPIDANNQKFKLVEDKFEIEGLPRDARVILCGTMLESCKRI